MWGPGPQVWGWWHAGLRVPVRETPDRAALQGVATSCIGTARAWETSVTWQKHIYNTLFIICYIYNWLQLTGQHNLENEQPWLVDRSYSDINFEQSKAGT